MRIGPYYSRLVALLAIVALNQVVVAQGRYSDGYQQPQFHAAAAQPAPSGPMQALFMRPVGMAPESQYMDAHGGLAVVPASYHAPSYLRSGGGCAESCGAGCACGGGAPYGRGTYPAFGGYGENHSLLAPYRTEQSGPHYFDVRMEAVFMTRDEEFSQQVDFTTGNVANPVELSSSQLEFDDAEVGFRIMGRYDLGALSVLEFGYTGLESLDARASFTDPTPVDADTGSLYSLFTDFVRDAGALPGGVTTDDSGVFPGTERSLTHSISLESELHVAEMNYRRYWVGYSPHVSGTMLAGFRFTRLREDFDFTAVGEATGQYLLLAKNDLAGFQAGGDMWVRLMRGLRAGAEAKVGIFNNHYTLDNTFVTDPPNVTAPEIDEHFEKDVPAFIGEASIDVVADLTPSWSLRAGAEIHYLNSLVLAGDNFNTGTVYTGVPGVTLPPRVPFIDDQGDAFYYGGHIGAEFIW